MSAKAILPIIVASALSFLIQPVRPLPTQNRSRRF
jgi:hypothetical protein